MCVHTRAASASVSARRCAHDGTRKGNTTTGWWNWRGDGESAVRGGVFDAMDIAFKNSVVNISILMIMIVLLLLANG